MVDNKKETIFAIFPVKTQCQKTVWLKKVNRVWNPNKNFSILIPGDPGDYVGGWDYFKI